VKVLGALVALALILFGWPALVLLVYNAVAVALGWKVLTYWVMFGLMFLLGVVAQYFRSQKG
jgi:hypothetical protein